MLNFEIKTSNIGSAIGSQNNRPEYLTRFHIFGFLLLHLNCELLHLDSVVPALFGRGVMFHQ